MSRSNSPALALSGLLFLFAAVYPSLACCPAPPKGDWVLNADQTVIMIWDPAAKRQHFIRQASFQADAKDFAFLIPTPSQPELEEAGNETFATLREYTKPQVIHRPRGGGCNLGCSAEKFAAEGAAKSEVRVLEQKLVAGFQATVLEADDLTVLVKWLEENGYNYSAAVSEWAEPYVAQGWKFTALKVAPPEPTADEPGAASAEGTSAAKTSTVKASALRLSFNTDRPLFPYREPNYVQTAGGSTERQNQLAAAQRLLRVYFLSNARYEGELTATQPWTGKVAWAGKLADHQRTVVLEQLKLPADTGPKDFYLTEFEDHWPYKVAPADLYFAAAKDQSDVERPPVYVSREAGGDVSLAVLIALAFAIPLWKRRRK
jgi:hypothetical protein